MILFSSGEKKETGRIRQSINVCLSILQWIPKHIIMSSLRCAAMLFPVDRNKVFFSNFSGKRYGDSPKYISEALHESNPEVTIVWQQKRGYHLDFPDYVRVVTIPSFRSIYELTTSGIWVDSHLKSLYVKKRKGQFFLNTWHGGLGFKRIENDVSNPEKTLEKWKALRTAKMVDIFLSNSRWIEDIYQSAFGYHGKVARTGFPKNDFLLGDVSSAGDKVREQYGLQGRYVILYAPTFRDVPVKEQFAIDPGEIMRTAEQSVGKGRKAVFLVRFHPVIQSAARFFSFSQDVINVTDYPDSQELIAAADCVISDYSSIVFDAAFLKKPVFLFTPDYEQYAEEIGFYIGLDEYPFSYGSDTESVCANILRYDHNEYLRKVQSFMEKVELTETGNATEEAVRIIQEELRKGQEAKRSKEK